LIVLKDFLQLDPLIDIVLHRIGASFIRPGSGEEAASAIGRLAAAAGPGDAVVLFPEGGNFSPERRERAIAKLDLDGRPDLALRAERFSHLLPPRLLGASTAIDAAPSADVMFVGHTGLEALSTPWEIWRNLPSDLPVTTRAWCVGADAVPPADRRETWLFDAWQRIDDWADVTMVEQAATTA
jgi:1-acyl-sn-glycerol-3-phosphate acyltransferase